MPSINPFYQTPVPTNNYWSTPIAVTPSNDIDDDRIYIADGYATVFDLDQSEGSSMPPLKEIWLSKVEAGDYPESYKLTDKTVYRIGTQEISASSIQAEYEKMGEHPQATVHYTRKSLGGKYYELTALEVIFKQ